MLTKMNNNNTIKTLAVVAALGASLSAPLAASATSQHQLCDGLSAGYAAAANLRDIGFNPSQVRTTMLSYGIPDSMITPVLEAVFIHGKNLTPEMLKQMAYSVCMKQGA